MTLNSSGAVLEGVKLAQSVNPLVLSPRSLIQDKDSNAFQGTTSRSEYCVVAWNLKEDACYINSSDLKFAYVINNEVIRFTYDNINQRWFPAPGSSPVSLGAIGNIPRLKAPLPIAGAASHYQICLNLPRVTTFVHSVVESFGSPKSGHVEILKSTGELNFNDDDIANPQYANQTVYLTRQNFFDPAKYDGTICTIGEDGSYSAFLNPIPVYNEFPLIRIGYTKYLNPVSFPSESSMTVPSNSYDVHYALDTGRVFIYDSDSHAGEQIFYDGVFNGFVTPTQNNIGIINPAPGIMSLVGNSPSFKSLTDLSRYVFWANTIYGQTYYFYVEASDSLPFFLPPGYVFINTNNGDVFVSQADSFSLAGATLGYLDTYLPIINKTTFQIYRSGVNGQGAPKSFDFYINYNVTDAVVVNGISASPFAVLPSRPLNDSTLSYKITTGVGSNGTFTGDLNVASDSTKTGPCYYLDFKSKRISFYNRKTATRILTTDTNTIKLDDAAILDKGIVVKLDSKVIKPGIDFDFDSTSGVLTFLESVGESSSVNVSDVVGSVSGNTFTTSTSVFNSFKQGSYLLVKNGDNAGFYEIISVVNSYTVNVGSNFPVAKQEIVDVKSTKEIISDRVWKPLNPPMKKFKLEKKDPDSNIYIEFSQDKYKVIPQVGQINLNSLAKPNEIYKAHYTSQDSDDNGVTVKEHKRTEYLASKVRLEQATYTKGSKHVSINPDNLTVLDEKGFRVIVDSVTLDNPNIKFTAPHNLYIGIPLTDQVVYVDYWVAECTGGNKTFNLTYTPVIADYPSFVANSNKISLNGNLTSDINVDTAFYVNDIDIYIVKSVDYDADNDITNVEFISNIVNDYSGGFSISQPLNFKLVLNSVETIANGSNSVTIDGKSDIVAEHVILIEYSRGKTKQLYPFYVIAASYDSNLGKTELTLNTSTKLNFLHPKLYTSTGKIIKPKKEFTTKKSANINSPFTLFRGGDNPRILNPGVDYTVSDGGMINLTSNLEYGQTLEVCYAARKNQKALSVFEFNYAYAIAPDESVNGLLGQNLVSNYTLYSPDSFFYRVETIKSYIPEVSSSMSQGSTPSTSGPSTAGVPAIKNKDYGVKSLYFDEQKYYNLDFVTKRLLKYFNDFIDLYEDLLSNYDGRVVGGVSGRFRYDGDGKIASSMLDVSNDIDDRIKLYDGFSIKSLDPLAFELIPVYGYLWETNRYSRLFPTESESNFGLNDQAALNPANLDATISNLNYTSITGLSQTTSARAISNFVAIDSSTLRIEKNGDKDSSTPLFKSPQKVYLYEDNGTYVGENEITSISGNNPGPFYLQLKNPISLDRGGVVSNINYADDPNNPPIYNNRFYFPGMDYIYDPNSGDVKNFSMQFLIDAKMQRQLYPKEILNTIVSYNNSSTTPKRFPALNGSSYSDSGLRSNPPLHRYSEYDALQYEIDFFTNSLSVTANVNPTNTVTNSNLVVSVGDQVEFINGPNAGQVRVVSFVVNPTTFTVTSPFNNTDSSNSKIIKTSSLNSYKQSVNKLLGILNNNSKKDPVKPAYIDIVDSEIKSIESIITNMGDTVYSGSASVNGAVLTAPLNSFSDLLNSYIFIDNGLNRGLYKVESFTSSTATVSINQPFFVFPSPGSVSCKIIKLYEFMTGAGPNFLVEAYKKTLEFYTKTYVWYNNFNYSQIASRIDDINLRLLDLKDLISKAEQVCKSGDSLYDRRFLWIQQRTDRQSGFLVKMHQAISSRVNSLNEIVNNQKKALILQTLGI